jgi:hypothetical protein
MADVRISRKQIPVPAAECLDLPRPAGCSAGALSPPWAFLYSGERLAGGAQRAYNNWRTL